MQSGRRHAREGDEREREGREGGKVGGRKKGRLKEEEGNTHGKEERRKKGVKQKGKGKQGRRRGKSRL